MHFLRNPGHSFAALTASLLLFAAQGSAQVQSARVRWAPSSITNGSPVFFRITAGPNVRSVSADWIGHHFDFYRGPRSQTWFALAGVPLNIKPGAYPLKITEQPVKGAATQIDQQVRVFLKSYPKITVKVAKRYTEPDTKQLAAIAVDKTEKQKTFESVTSERLWSGPFSAPVSAAVSDVFGTARVFNQEVQSRHQGLDYAVPAGTPVHAINDGVVVLARPMYFEGNFIVVDHGQGLLSLYLHLSEFRVKEGDHVETGQTIALSGGTGRATGAHLHLAIRWQGIYLDPAVLLKLPIPPASTGRRIPVPNS